MSAIAIPEDWREQRMRYALKSGAVDLPALAEAFGLDLDETTALVQAHACYLGITFLIPARMVLH